MKYEDLLTRNKYPNGKGIATVKIFHRYIGSYIEEQKGFHVFGSRKYTQTEEAAIENILRKRMSELDHERGIILDVLK